MCFFFFKQKTAYEMRISDWSSDVCSSDLQCSGGDDYELCFTLPRERREAMAAIAEATKLAMTRIGRIVPGDAVVALDANGNPWQIGRASCRERVYQYV